jgi:hypothetical protein
VGELIDSICGVLLGLFIAGAENFNNTPLSYLDPDFSVRIGQSGTGIGKTRRRGDAGFQVFIGGL